MGGYHEDIRAGCTDFPTRVPIRWDRELLATDGTDGGNATGIGTVNASTTVPF